MGSMRANFTENFYGKPRDEYHQEYMILLHREFGGTDDFDDKFNRRSPEDKIQFLDSIKEIISGITSSQWERFFADGHNTIILMGLLAESIRTVEVKTNGSWVPYKDPESKSKINYYLSKVENPLKNDLNDHNVRELFQPTLKKDGKKYRLIQNRLCLDKDAILAKIHNLKPEN